MIFEILFEFLFVFDDSVIKGDTVGTDDVGINDEIVFGVGVPHGHSLVPDFFTIGWFDIHASDNGGEE